MGVPLDLIDVLSRWGHLMGVVIWMGHNLANVVQNPYFYRALEHPTCYSTQLNLIVAIVNRLGLSAFLLGILGTGLYLSGVSESWSYVMFLAFCVGHFY